MRSRKPFLLTMAAALFFGAAWLASQSSTQTTLVDPPSGADAVFLVRLGVTDRSETAWNGSVEVTGGELVKLAGYEMRVDDVVHPPARWEARTRNAFMFQRRPHDEDYLKDVQAPVLLQPSLYVYVRGPQSARVKLTTQQGEVAFAVSDVPPATEKAFLNGRVLVQRTSLTTLVGRRRGQAARGRLTDNDHPSITVARDNATWIAWQGFRPDNDQVFAERIRGGQRQLHTVSVKPGDIYRTAIAEDTEGKMWVVWSERDGSNWDLYARAYDGETWGSLARLTTEAQPDAQHQMVRAPDGSLHLVWQGWRDNRAGIFHMRYSVGEGWSQAARVSAAGAGNCWEPSIAVDSKGLVHVAWDQYGANGYDIWMRTLASGLWHTPVAVASTPLFEAYSSLAVDKQDRVWIAWHESGINWGKDWGYPYDIKAKATGLYNSRNIRVAVREGARQMEPAQQLEAALPPPGNNFWEYPKLAADGEGRIHAFVRKRTPQQWNVYPRTPSHQALWEIYTAHWMGAKWSGPTLVPYSTGRHDMRLAAAVDQSGVLVGAWPTDRRGFRDMVNTLPDIFTGRFEAADAPAATQLTAYTPPSVGAAEPVHANEAADVKRIREYTYKTGSQTYHIYRGDMHRHTEISWDGYSDGSTEDTYRYAMDAAAMDYLAITEHNFGVEDEYDWWRSQKFCDLFRVGTSFVPLYAYERSAIYPNGHRNIVFSYRGAPVLDVQHYEWVNNANNLRQGAERLFGYLRKYNGVAMPHTSATDMGTDWRDYDPEVEPVVEIYQSDRNSYECPDCWRAAPKDIKKMQYGGYQPAGFVSNAWQKGYRLGVQASSDHLGVHTSYAMILAPANNREALVDAIRKRHTYGATDNIIVDFRLVDGGREYVMGDDARVAGPARFRIHIEGTGPVQDVEIVKDNKAVFKQQPRTKVVDLEYRDSAPPGKEASFYYVRVRQVDQQIAWGSPIWVALR
ncbi:MAG: hypothetical protein FJW39_18935 [Acidobacteria bacterium]|nr:hypothetical protein [Acidobacteriota bacterium]